MTILVDGFVFRLHSGQTTDACESLHSYKAYKLISQGNGTFYYSEYFFVLWISS